MATVAGVLTCGTTADKTKGACTPFTSFFRRQINQKVFQRLTSGSSLYDPKWFTAAAADTQLPVGTTLFRGPSDLKPALAGDSVDSRLLFGDDGLASHDLSLLLCKA